eukprot:6477691-Amphidinium_carterae.1
MTHILFGCKTDNAGMKPRTPIYTLSFDINTEHFPEPTSMRLGHNYYGSDSFTSSIVLAPVGWTIGDSRHRSFRQVLPIDMHLY